MGDMDSTEQAKRLGSPNWLDALDDPDDEVLRDALGRLRFEALLSNRLVLTDAQALDGRIFLGLALSGLLAELQPEAETPVLEIRARLPTLSESAWAMVDARRGGAFRSSFLSNGARVESETIGKEGAGTDLQSIADYLTRAGAEEAEVSALVTGWRAVTTAADKNDVTIKTWDPERTWPAMVQKAQEYLPLVHLEDVLANTSESREELRRLSRIEVRTSFRNEVERGSWNAMDREALETWFDECYRRATAFQHRADYRAIHSDALGRIYARCLALQSSERRTTFIDLPEWFIPQLGNLPAIEWRTAYTGAHRHLREWWTVGDTSALRRCFDSFIPLLDPSGTSTRRFPRTLVTLGLKLPASLMALTLQPNAAGVATTLAIALGDFIVTNSFSDRTRTHSIKVTDYLDDVERWRA